MKQRLGIARAVIHDPPLLVLDEPAAGLDPKSRHDLKQLLRGFQERGCTIVIPSHILPDLEEICTSLSANSIESAFVLSARKVACRICAQYVQFTLFGNVVPESFQTNSCTGLTLRPQHRGTLCASCNPLA
jgi:ABC-type Mn2+/Zn2+ transport system ATPase subunit